MLITVLFLMPNQIDHPVDVNVKVSKVCRILGLVFAKFNPMSNSVGLII